MTALKSVFKMPQSEKGMCNAFRTILKILKKTLTQIPAETDEKRKKETYYSKLIDIPIGKLFHNSHTNTHTGSVAPFCIFVFVNCLL